MIPWHVILHARRQTLCLIDLPGAKVLAHNPARNQTRPRLTSDYSDTLLGNISPEDPQGAASTLYEAIGLLMHSSLAVTLDGLPLGLSAKKFWTRTKFKGTAALKKKISPTRVPIEEKESFRWLENMRQSIATVRRSRAMHPRRRSQERHLRAFCTAHELGTHFLARTCVDRLAGDGEHTIATEMNEEDQRAA